MPKSLKYFIREISVYQSNEHLVPYSWDYYKETIRLHGYIRIYQ